MSLQDRIQSSTIVGEDSSNPLSVVYDDVSGHLQIDYSSYYNRIATAFETVASNSTAIKNAIETVASNSTAIKNAIETVASNSTAIKNSLSTIAEKQTAIETYQKKLKELGEGNGIRVVGPYEIVQFINTYRILVEEGRILGWRENMPSDKDIAKTLNDLGKYIEKIKQNIPKEF